MENRKPVDRRINRTRTRLRNALVKLILEMPYDQITVQNILDEADVSRSTFYAHFQDKEALLQEGLPDDILSYGLNDSDSLLPAVTGMFAHVLEGRAWLEAMGGNAGMMLVSQMARQRMVENWLSHIERWQQANGALKMPETAVAHYLTGALMALLLWWINEGMPQTPQQMNTMFQQLAGEGVAQWVR
jgi:AcrR family transcriptional regulator